MAINLNHQEDGSVFYVLPNYLNKIMAAIIALFIGTAFAQTTSILSEATQNAVAKFKQINPEWASEFVGFEQDCIDGKTNDKQCEAAVKEQLADLEREIKVNAKEAQVKIQGEMVDRIGIVTVVLQLNNSIQHGNPDRSGITSLESVKNPILQNDITFLRTIDTKLAQKKTVNQQEITKLQAILISQAQEALRIYSSLSSDEQKKFINSKTIAIGAQKYALK